MTGGDDGACLFFWYPRRHRFSSRVSLRIDEHSVYLCIHEKTFTSSVEEDQWGVLNVWKSFLLIKDQVLNFSMPGQLIFDAFATTLSTVRVSS